MYLCAQLFHNMASVLLIMPQPHRPILKNVSVPIANCICLNCKLYLSKLQIVFDQIAKYICVYNLSQHSFSPFDNGPPAPSNTAEPRYWLNLNMEECAPVNIFDTIAQCFWLLACLSQPVSWPSTSDPRSTHVFKASNLNMAQQEEYEQNSCSI